MVTLDLAGKIVLITGGTQGIGEAIARAAREAGAAGIGITGRNRERGEQVAADLIRLGCEALFVPANLEDAEACRDVARKTLAHFGRLDGLVNAAGLTDRGTIENTTVDLWDRIFAVNARAPFILAQEAVAHWKATGRAGSIVNIITMSSHGGQPFITAYCASKGALATMTKNMANALRWDRIRVNGVNIGWTDSPGEHVIQQEDGRPDNWLEGKRSVRPWRVSSV